MVIHYTYEVAGRDYTGTRVYAGDELSPSLNTAKKYVEYYPVGKKVTVYYDPNDPRSAVLERGTSKKTYLDLVFGLGFTFFAGWIFAGSWWLFQGRARKKVTRIVVLVLGLTLFAPWFWLLVWMYEH